MRAALIALMLTIASQAGAALLDDKQSERILLYGKIMHLREAGDHQTVYHIRFEERFYQCKTSNFMFHNTPRYKPHVEILCIDSTKIKHE